jgi:hypothetical protein
MKNSRDWKNGEPNPDRKGVERSAPLQQERNFMTRKLAIGVLALVLMLSSHEALAHGGGGFGGGQGQSFYGGRSYGRTLERGFHGSGFGVGGNRGVGLGGRGFSHSLVSPGQVGDPYWSPCNYDSYGPDSCGG